MAADKDDVLSLESGDEDSEFSGFEPLLGDGTNSKSSDAVGANKQDKKKGKTNAKAAKSTHKLLSKGVCAQKDDERPSTSSAAAGSAQSVSAKSSSAKSGAKQSNSSSSKRGSQKSKKNTIDLDNLSQSDIIKLRQIVGMDTIDTSHEMAEEEDIRYVFGDSLENLPQIHVEFENEPASDVEVIPETHSFRQPLRSIQHDINNARFNSNGSTQSASGQHNEVVSNDEDFTWQLPKLKCPEKGEPISPSLASLINATCSSQCDTDEIVSKYKLPSNCDKLAPPLVNGEIWTEIHKKAQTYDKAFRDIQSLIATGLSPIFYLLKVLKDPTQSRLVQKLES